MGWAGVGVAMGVREAPGVDAEGWEGLGATEAAEAVREGSGAAGKAEAVKVVEVAVGWAGVGATFWRPVAAGAAAARHQRSSEHFHFCCQCDATIRWWQAATAAAAHQLGSTRLSAPASRLP